MGGRGRGAVLVGRGLFLGRTGPGAELALDLVDPCVGEVGDLGQGEQIIAVEVAGVLPLAGLLVAVHPLEGHAEAWAVLGVVGPDRGLDGPEPDVVERGGGCWLGDVQSPFCCRLTMPPPPPSSGKRRSTQALIARSGAPWRGPGLPAAHAQHGSRTMACDHRANR